MTPHAETERTLARRRARKARIHRRRRLGALIVLVVLSVTIAVLAKALMGGGDTGAIAPSSSPSASPSARPSTTLVNTGPSQDLRLKLRDTIASQAIAPKSIVSSGTGYAFAQNMMYRHTITIYNTESLKLVKTIKDSVRLADFGYSKRTAVVQGAPVEAAESPDHRYMYVSQYSMFGEGFSHPGGDTCSPASGVDDSFVYRIPLDSLAVDAVIKVGAVPKFLAVTPDGRYLLVSNWCSYSLSVVNTETNREVKSVSLGPYPRGIAVSPDSHWAYVAIMGSRDIARVDLETYAVTWLRDVGAQPRHLTISPDGTYLYATLNGEGRVARIHLATGKVKKVVTGSQPRSMAMAADGGSLYVVNYTANTMSKVRTRDMRVVQVVNTNPAPIGVTYDVPTRSVWVCCYGGSIMVFRDAKP